MSLLKEQLLRLGSERPKLRRHLRPILDAIRTADELPYLEFNTALARKLKQLKRDVGATKVRQNYRGTGSKRAHRQLYVGLPGGTMDLWLRDGHISLGGVVNATGISVRYDNKSVDQVYAEVKRVLETWIEERQGV